MLKRCITKINRCFSAVYNWFKKIFCLKPNSNNSDHQETDFKDIEIGLHISISTDFGNNEVKIMENYMNMEYEINQNYDSEFPRLFKNSEDTLKQGETSGDIDDTYDQIQVEDDVSSQSQEITRTPEASSEHEDDGSEEPSEGDQFYERQEALSEEQEEPSEGQEEYGINLRNVEEALKSFQDEEESYEEQEQPSQGQEELCEEEENGVDLRNVEEAFNYLEDEELQIPKGSEVRTTENSTKKLRNNKLKWEPKASVPKYSSLNSKLLKDGVKVSSITTRGKAVEIAQKITETNLSRVKHVKEQFKKDFEEKKAADLEARTKIVEAERKRVAEAKKKLELKAQKTKQEALERHNREMEERQRIRKENEAKKEKILKARVEEIMKKKEV